MIRTYRVFGALLALVALVACDDPGTSSTPARIADANGELLQGPATPPPTPRPGSTPYQTPAVATPGPATPYPTPVVPSPTSPATPTPTPEASAPSLDPSSSPFRQTGVPTDLAVSGPAYFVLATKPNPAATSDLLFTRNGHFTFVHEAAGSLSLWRLRHATTNFHVVGFLQPGGTAAGAPDETSMASGVELATTWGGVPTAGLALFIDAERNPDAPASVALDFTGRLLVDQGSPRGSDGGPVQLYVALAAFAHPEKLVPQPGFDGMLKYDPAAGAVGLGVAVSGANRPVGNANLILTGKLESPSP